MAITNLQYDQIMRRYQERRSRNAALLDRRKEEVYSGYPELRKIEEEIASASVAEAKNRLSGNIDEDYMHRLAELICRRDEILGQAGYRSEDMEGIYDCPYCHDTGYTEEGRCLCFRKEISEILMAQSGLPNVLSEENFENFSLQYYSARRQDPITGHSEREVAAEALEICKKFVDDFDKEFRNLFIYGNPGVGKTFLANCIAGELLRSGHTVIYMKAFEFFEALADSRFRKDEEKLPINEYVYDSDLLIIDDLGTEMTNKFIASEFFNCLNERFMRRKATIISTNLSLKNIPELYSERVFSRITSGYVFIRLLGEDIRLNKKLRTE